MFKIFFSLFIVFSFDLFSSWIQVGYSNYEVGDCVDSDVIQLSGIRTITICSIKTDSQGNPKTWRESIDFANESCPHGMFSDSNGVCTPVCFNGLVPNGLGSCVLPVVCPSTQYIDATTNTCRNIDFPYFSGNPTGCRGFGGLYYADGTCLSPSNWSGRFLQDPLTFFEGGLYLGHLLVTAAGLIALAPEVATAAAAAGGAYPLTTSIGIHSAAAGGIAYLLNNPTQPASSDNSPAPSGSIRVDLTDYQLSSTPDTHSTTLTATDPTTGRVQTAYTIPDSITSQLNDPSNINPTTHTLINPIDTTGLQTSTYDYSNNTATTTTQTSPTTVNTQTTSIALSQNSDGTVLTIPSTPIAPVVTGSSGGGVISSNFTGAAPASGSSTTNNNNNTNNYNNNGDGHDYTGVLNSIKTNTDKTAQNTKSISDQFASAGDVFASFNDGSGAFSSFDTTLRGSFSSFVYNDPLGLSTIGSGQDVPTYSFNLLGQTFTLFDQNLFNNLPLALIKSILLFVAAVSGFIVVLTMGS